MAKIRVAVIFGGRSNEYEVSLVSAAHIIRSIPEDKYDVIRIGITKKGRWFRYIGSISGISDGIWENHPDNVPCVLSPDPIHKGFIEYGEDGSARIVKIDCVFPVIHGRNGEDGRIQGILEMAQIPYVGCDLLSSAMCMDKDITHTILEANGIKTAQWVRILKSELNSGLEEKYSYPVFVKPCNCGSSVGISKASDRAELVEAIKLAFTHDKKVIVEKAVTGRECECAVMGNDQPFASEIGEINAANDFYDYESKYNDPRQQTVIPADISEEDSQRLRETAVKAYKAMGCEGLARVDFFLCADGGIILNEINTMPGHTPISMYPQLMEHKGISPSEQEDRLIRLAFERAGIDHE